jgi:hypothetical protein
MSEPLPRLLAAANHANIEDHVRPLMEGETWLVTQRVDNPALVSV